MINDVLSGTPRLSAFLTSLSELRPFGVKLQVALHRVRCWHEERTLGSGLAMATVSLLLIAAADRLLGFGPAIRALYVLPVWLATRADGRRAGLLSVAVVTAILATMDPNVFGERMVQQAFVRFACFGAVMLMIAQVEERCSSFRTIAFRDPLTGLLNRRALIDFATGVFRPRSQDPAVVVMIDCDGFKGVNDTYGHQAGDHVLRMLARILEFETRSEDLVARMGGDEFALVLSHATVEDAQRVLTRIEESFERQVKDAGYACTISVGVATMVEEVDSLDEILRHADRAMYERKAGKKARARAYLN